MDKAFSGMVGQWQAPAVKEMSVIVEASEIPILSSTDRLQRALLRWIDVCGLAGQFTAEDDVIVSLEAREFLDGQTFVVALESHDPTVWPVVWSGANVMLPADCIFFEALLGCIPEHRFVHLMTSEYVDALRYRRASAKRFVHRHAETADIMDQLIFPLRDASQNEFVLVIGEPIAGRTLYSASSGDDVVEEAR